MSARSPSEEERSPVFLGSDVCAMRRLRMERNLNRKKATAFPIQTIVRRNLGAWLGIVCEQLCRASLGPACEFFEGALCISCSIMYSS